MTCPDAVVLSGPGEDAEPLYCLDHAILRAAPDTPETEGNPSWRGVVLPDGRTGWVEDSCIRSHLDYRAGFERREGEWKLVLLVAGD